MRASRKATTEKLKSYYIQREAKLRVALVDTVEALEAHVREGAHRNGVSPELYCPCLGQEIAQARQVLKEVAL